MRSTDDTAATKTQLLVGRARERARLLALVGSERVVAVVGAAGIGKSALVRASLPAACVISLADCRDEAACAARLAASGDAPVVVAEDVPAPLAERVAARAAELGAGVVVLVSRVAIAALPTVELGPLDDADARALVAALDAAASLHARVAAGGHPAEIVRRLAAAHAAIARDEAGALAALYGGRFADALDGDPIVAAAALCGLDELDRAAALVHAHGQHPRAPLVALALLWRRGELRACVERGERLMAALEDAGDALGHAAAATIVARAAFGLGDIARAEALLRAVEGAAAGARHCRWRRSPTSGACW